MPRHYENIDWHRESFYRPNLEKSVNIWTPIRGVSSRNSLRYIPNSHTIPDNQITTYNEGSTVNPKYSVGHQLGFNYDPKVIINGVDLNQAETMVVPEKSSAIFSGNLIHGAAINLDSKIRFSIDFQVIRKSDYSSSNKNFRFSSGKPYFIDL
jgi:ectoine hydroxylase-related dioxygenase (phytanoyl-CoA dioxygenase family)